jgi:hypothetical protein
MVDPISTIGAGLAVIGSKDILTKILGPTADYIGGEIKGLVEKCNINLDNIFKIAKKKLGARLEEQGSVNPRILKDIINEGRFSDDELMSEYYGGILASSKCRNGRDDRGVVHLSTIRQLSVYQLRLHYLFYSLIRRNFLGSSIKFGLISERPKLRLYIPLSVYNAAMQFTGNEDSMKIIPHSVSGLIRHELIGEFRFYGELQDIKEYYSGASEYGLILEPSLLGAELFFWGEGIPDATGLELLSNKICTSEPIIPIIDSAKAVYNHNKSGQPRH